MEKEQLIQVVSAAQKGDNEALNRLFNNYYNELYYFALKTVKDSDLASDITQEAFIDIINNLHTLKEPVAFVSWAKKITYNQCTRYFKKKKDVLVDEDEDGNTIFDTLEADEEFIPSVALEKEDFKKTIMAMIDELSDEQRSAVMMFYYDELSVKAIAEIQGVSEGTVKSRLNYARKAIKKSVEDYEKKHNIKLHSFGFLPFFLWLFDGVFEKEMSPTVAAEVAQNVSTATGTTISVSTASAVATTTATVGILAKLTALPIATKIIAGIVAATVIIGGAICIGVLSNPSDKESGESINGVTDEPSDSIVNTDNGVYDFVPLTDPNQLTDEILENLVSIALEARGSWIAFLKDEYVEVQEVVFINDSYNQRQAVDVVFKNTEPDTYPVYFTVTLKEVLVKQDGQLQAVVQQYSWGGPQILSKETGEISYMEEWSAMTEGIYYNQDIWLANEYFCNADCLYSGYRDGFFVMEYGHDGNTELTFTKAR